MLFISQHSGGRYQAYADMLKKSLRRFDLEHQVVKVEDSGDWHENVSTKPAFIYGMLKKEKRPIVWLDADCSIESRPELLFAYERAGVDLAAYNWYADRNSLTEKGDPKHPHNPELPAISSGVLYCAYNERVLDLLDVWSDLCACREDLYDDHVLSALIFMGNRFTERWDLKYEWLPKAYNRMELHWPDVDPVINHECRRGAIYDGSPKQ